MFDIVWRPYQNMFGEIGDTTLIKTMNEAYCKLQINSTNSSPSFNKADCENGLYDCFKNDNKICMYNVYIVKTLLAAYMMLAAVLMLNLMVAGKLLFRKHRICRHFYVEIFIFMSKFYFLISYILVKPVKLSGIN